MERVLSPEEKIRRAEEIYERRKNQNYRRTTATVNVSSDNRDFKLLKKMIIQILICLLIYFIFYLIQTTNYVFSASTLSKTKEILNYDIDVQGLYAEIKDNFVNNDNSNEIQEDINEEKEELIIEDVSEDQNNVEENTQNEVEITSDEEQEEVNNETAELVDETEELTIAQEILRNYSIIKPVEGGFISSEFGTREEEGEVVTSYHNGIDIAVVEGTDVVAATDGEVILSIESESYGKYIKIQNDDLVTLYAHCNELNVKEGDIVKQGDIIAKSGSTGKVTRTSFTF